MRDVPGQQGGPDSLTWTAVIGIFQEYYETTLLADYPPSTIAWILSLETFILFFGGIWVGLLFDNYGPRPLLAIGLVLHVFGLMMTSLSTQYWQLLLAQGVVSPLGAAPCFYAALASVVTWFDRRRGLALGLSASGSSLGGVIFPIMVQRLIPRVGFPWAMRIAAFMILGLLLVGLATVRPRVPSKPRRFHFRALIKPWTNPNFVLLTVGCFCIFLGLLVPFNYVQLSAVAVSGVSVGLAQYIIPVLNATSIFGRITPGWAADKVGRFNVTAATCTLCGVFVLALWLPATNTGLSFAFAVCYGFSSGAFVTIVPALVAAVSPDMHEIGTNVGVLFATISFAALVGNPIGGALVTAAHGKYWALCIFTGVTILLGTALVTCVRMRLAGWKLAAKV